MTETLKQSTAVVARRDESKDSLDFFPTPAWATRALMEFLEQEGHDLGSASVLEPACGLGHMAVVLDEHFKETTVSDIHDWRTELGAARYVFHKSALIGDYLQDDFPVSPGQYDFIISNPPFKNAGEFALKSIENAKTGVALLMRVAFLETIGRYEDIFSKTPPSHVLIFSERLGFLKNRVLKKTASATCHSWFLWLKGHEGRCQVDWIKPGSQKRLERPEDYDEDRIAGSEIETADLFEDE